MSADQSGSERQDAVRHRLTDARHSRGWSQETLAMLLRNRGLGTTRKSVMRWERGVVPDNAAQSALAQLFGIPLKARSTASWPSWLPTGRVTGVGQTWDDPGTIEVLTEVAEYAIVDRREFIALT